MRVILLNAACIRVLVKTIKLEVKIKHKLKADNNTLGAVGYIIVIIIRIRML